MLYLWGFLACLYGTSAVSLAVRGDWGGTLVVSVLTVLFLFLCRRSFRLRREKQRQKHLLR